jgi:S-disulfanyl-L-cysteine oxidoreductase SoxD
MAASRLTALSLLLLSLPISGLGGAPSTLQAQIPDAPPPRTSAGSGVYTVEQAREGGAIFEQHCSRCHSPQEYRSTPFRTKWTSRTLHDLYLVISGTMPLDQPASLQSRQYAELLAFVLEVNGFPPGSVALGWEEKELAGITIDPPP